MAARRRVRGAAPSRAALCVHDLLADHPWIRTACWTYVPFHGPDALRAAYAYFDNDHEAHAVADGRWLARRLGVPAPPVASPAGRAP